VEVGEGGGGLIYLYIALLWSLMIGIGIFGGLHHWSIRRTAVFAVASAVIFGAVWHLGGFAK
jgi:hypothetical protein